MCVYLTVKGTPMVKYLDRNPHFYLLRRNIGIKEQTKEMIGHRVGRQLATASAFFLPQIICHMSYPATQSLGFEGSSVDELLMCVSCYFLGVL